MPSSFPNSYDSFRTFSDPQVSDMTNVNRYRTLRAQTSLTTAEATELNSLLTTLRDKLILSEDFNLLTDSMVNMQVFTKETIQNYYQYRGNWTASPTPAYTIFNTVRYTDGQVYMALETPGSTAPTNATVWLLIGIKGDTGLQGPAGAALVYKQAYAAGTSYVVDDLVTYNGNTYYCKLNSTGNLPTNTTYWVLFMAGTNENLANLTTTNKTNLVSAINEVNTVSTGAANKVGDTTTLTTTNKTTTVDAINEVRSLIYTQAQVDTMITAAKKYQI